MKRMQEKPLPVPFDYHKIAGLPAEVIEKLNHVQPTSIRQAGHISGVTPAAMSLLLVYLKKQQMLTDAHASSTQSGEHLENQDLMMLENKLLIATPLLDKDPLFANTLVYVFEHNAEKGSAGVIVNKATNLNLMDVVERLDVRCPVAAKHKLEEVSILLVSWREDALILRKWSIAATNKKLLVNTWTLTEETLEALIETDTIQDFEIILGYCRWQCGQLEQEIVKGLWL